MVALPQAVDVEKQAGQSGNSVLIPPGQYPAVIVSSELKDTKTGGKMIVFTIAITQGEYAHTEFKDYVNIVNKNPQTVEIAYQTIANMGKAAGLKTINDSSELHNNAMMIEVKTKPAEDWIDNEGKTVAGKESSEIKKYLPMPGGAGVVNNTPSEEKAPTDSAPPSNPFAA